MMGRWDDGIHMNSLIYLVTLELLPGKEPHDFDADGGHQGLRAGEAIESPGEDLAEWSLDPKVVVFKPVYLYIYI